MHPHLSLVVQNEPVPPFEDSQAELQKLREVVIHLSKLSGMSATGAVIIHEVAQPITAAANYLVGVQRLLSSPRPNSTEQVLEAVGLAQQCLSRTMQIIRNVKELGAHKAFRARSLDLHLVAADVMKLYSDTWDLAPQVKLSTAASHVLGDRVQLAQVLSNLIRNAMEATEGQSVRRLSISSRLAADRMIEVRVEDNGPGIPPMMEQRLFCAFSSSKPEGLGVGLSLCRAIVEQHGGTIWAEALSDGVAFCFTLPSAAGSESQDRVSRPDTARIGYLDNSLARLAALFARMELASDQTGGG